MATDKPNAQIKSAPTSKPTITSTSSPKPIPLHLRTQTFFTPGSTHIRLVNYHPGDHTLDVVFRDSIVPYTHSHVPREVFDAWREWHDAGYSDGKFYHSHIKRYPLKSSPLTKPVS